MKFTNLKRGIAGVCAATLLTGMCVVPAFAAGSVEKPEAATNITSGAVDAASTVIKAQAEAAQISATVPTTVVASVDAAGVLTFPESTDFAITATNASWPVKVSDLKVTVETGYTLTATPAKSKDLSLSLDGVALTADSNSTAIANLKQTDAGSTPIGINMSGTLFKPSYSDVTNGLSLATLKWTLSAY